MPDLRCSWNGQNDRRAPQQPDQRQLRCCDLEPLGGLCDRAAGTGELARRQREPGNETYTGVPAILQDVTVSLVGDAVAVLHRYDRHHLASMLDLGHADFGKADMPNL